MGIAAQLATIDRGFATIASFPELKRTKVVIGESDPEGCAACPVATNPNNAYRNGTMYSSYTAEQIARTYQLADLHGASLIGSVTWAFEFEDQPWFYGFRDLATNGVAKPVLNVFRMLGRMTGDRVRVESTAMLPLEMVRDSGVRAQPDIGALATRSDSTIAVLVWNYHDDDLPAPAANVRLVLEGVREAPPTMSHYRVDAEHGNSWERWKAMGSPQPPTAAQQAELERAGELALLEAARKVDVDGGRVALEFELPRQAVSLVLLKW
jgi:xylan 1,4-beta-xylosidase